MKYAIYDSVALHETEDAILIMSPDLENGQEWFPKKFIDDDSEVWKKGHEGTFIVSSWIAERKGLI